ncbi:MAG: RAD55 family ATPase [Micromonosporaceae bacterium]
MDRLATGTKRLDLVLGGGLPRDAISLVIGLPGSGKTIFAQQLVFSNASAERPALYLTTVSEPLEKILRYGQSLSFFDPADVGSRVCYEDIGTILSEQGLPGVLDRVRDLIRDLQPAIIVIDSFKALGPYASSAGDFRRFLHDLAGMLSVFPVTSVWVGEYEEQELALAPEFAVADAIIGLSSGTAADYTSRTLRVLKLRGGGFQPGGHAYRISQHGISVYPRLVDPSSADGYEIGDHRVSSGIRAIDQLVGGGYYQGSSTLVVGPTGVGKTLMGMHFVFSGARLGERGLIATLQENPSQLERTAQGFGWSMATGDVELMYRNPVDLYVDEWIYDLLATIEATDAKRVLVDSLGDLRAASPDNAWFRTSIYSLMQRCSRLGVSIVTTYEVPELFGLTQLTERGASHVADNILLLQYRLGAQRLTRTLTVLKTRAGHHDGRTREFEITGEGVTLSNLPSS